MPRFTRRIALAAFSAFALTACGAADTGNAQTGNSGSGEIALTDITLGEANAPITMVEYASWTCPACLQFHSDVIPMIGAAIGVGNIFGSFLDAAMRNPSAAPQQTGNLFIGMALSEALGILSFLVAILILFVV